MAQCRSRSMCPRRRQRAYEPCPSVSRYKRQPSCHDAPHIFNTRTAACLPREHKTSARRSNGDLVNHRASCSTMTRCDRRQNDGTAPWHRVSQVVSKHSRLRWLSLQSKDGYCPAILPGCHRPIDPGDARLLSHTSYWEACGRPSSIAAPLLRATVQDRQLDDRRPTP